MTLNGSGPTEFTRFCVFLRAPWLAWSGKLPPVAPWLFYNDGDMCEGSADCDLISNSSKQHPKCVTSDEYRIACFSRHGRRKFWYCHLDSHLLHPDFLQTLLGPLRCIFFAHGKKKVDGALKVRRKHVKLPLNFPIRSTSADQFAIEYQCKLSLIGNNLQPTKLYRLLIRLSLI